MEGFATLGDYAASALELGELYRVERAGEGLKFDPDRTVSTASGGERRRAALAKLMAEAPELMLLDEPSLGLSPRLVSEIAEIIKRLNEEQSVTMLLVEQNARMALDIGDYGFVLEVGRIVMEDTCDRLKDAEDIQEFYLGMKDEGVRGRRRWKQRKTWR